MVHPKTKPSILLVDQYFGPLSSDVSRGLTDLYDVTVFQSFSYSRHNIFYRIVTWLAYSLHFYIYILFNYRKFTFLLLYSNPPLLLFFSFILPIKYGFIVYDLYPDILIEYLSIQRFVAFPFPAFILIKFLKLSRYLVARSLSRANFVFSVSHSIAAVLKSCNYSCYKRINVSVVYPWSSLDNTTSVLTTTNHSFLPENLLFLYSKPYFLYSGNIGFSHPINSFLDLALHMYSCFDFNIVFCVNDQSLSLLAPYLQQDKYSVLPIVRLTPQPDLTYTQLLKNSFFTLLATDSFSSRFSIPSKFFASLANGKPVICVSPLKSEIANIISCYSCGVVVPLDSPNYASISFQISTILNNQMVLKQYSANSLFAYNELCVSSLPTILSCVSQSAPR